ncbi:DNA-binding protein [Robertmurraya korlensis]|uniref:DNA-binding protein n=1 Tax=Robertmurraya korlensis TaxID=519977 RepID=UPI00203B5E69|nr:DNA-binding protein [Robertmurraya korlensis]MCM3600788.1 DNA-binding protein [Robertmurraya korlensis]
MSGTKSEFPKLAKPAIRALESAGLFRLQQLTEVQEEELAKLHGMGPKAIEQLRLALLEKGWQFNKK